jgi:ubiquinone/menaquinone biosynthesis C-methylase UbiE
MSVWSWLGPKLYDPFLAMGELRGLRQRRSVLLADVKGHVLEIGAGTGLNVRHYPPVDALVLTEPDQQMTRRLHSRLAGHPLSPTVVEAPAEDLPFDDDTFDSVISTMVLCTVPDPGQVLDEVRRVLRPNGRFLFIEHVRSEQPRLARWQDRLHSLWKPFALGCHCNRDTVALLSTSGWTVEALEHFKWRGMPFLVKPAVAGAATPDAAG